MTNKTKMTVEEMFLRARAREIDRLLAIPSVPAITGNARVIAKWPTTQDSALTGIPLFSGPSWSTRVW